MNDTDREYARLVCEILEEGKTKMDRTGTGTKSLFAGRIAFECGDTFPALTTKSVFMRGVAEELAFFLRGATDTSELSAKNVRIWEGNTRREFLDARGLQDYPEGEMGPGYGWQWKCFGAEYPSREGGVDQLQYVVEELRNDPYSRRAMLSGWNPKDLPKMALPPCHVSYQFLFDGERLNLSMYQRSCDVFLGLPFNMASCALLLNLVAREVNMKPGKTVISIGDAHLYLNHIELARQQISRKPRSPPRLILDDSATLWNFEASHARLEDYNPAPKIVAEMAV